MSSSTAPRQQQQQPNLAVICYLEFQKLRQTCLQDLQEHYPHHLEVVPQQQSTSSSGSSSNNSKTLLQIWMQPLPNTSSENMARTTASPESQQSPQLGQHDAGNTNKSLELVWLWKWKEGRDVLRLTMSASSIPGLKQPHLDALIQVCDGQCDRALQLLLERIVDGGGGDDDVATHPQRHATSNQHVDADDEADDDDENHDRDKDQRRVRNVANPRAAKMSKKRKRVGAKARPPPSGVVVTAPHQATTTLAPKNPPVRDRDGSFKRPRGARPSGFVWDSLRGVWVAEQQPE